MSIRIHAITICSPVNHDKWVVRILADDSTDSVDFVDTPGFSYRREAYSCRDWINTRHVRFEAAWPDLSLLESLIREAVYAAQIQASRQEADQTLYDWEVIRHSINDRAD